MPLKTRSGFRADHIDALDLGGSAARAFAASEQGSEAGGFKAGEVEGLGDDNFYWHAGQGTTCSFVSAISSSSWASSTRAAWEHPSTGAGLALERF